jgi:hypothetical protein
MAAREPLKLGREAKRNPQIAGARGLTVQAGHRSVASCGEPTHNPRPGAGIWEMSD